MRINKKATGTGIRVIIFLMLLFHFFLFFTYLFRDTSNSGRQVFLEYCEEPEDTLDVVLIGTSNIQNYWDPMYAWNNYGFTSRNYAAAGGHVYCYLPAIKEVMKTQSPDLLIVEARGFTKSYSGHDVQPQARKFLDSLDVGFDRINAVKYYCESRNISWKDALPLYIDLIYYHNNYAAFASDVNWMLADNRLSVYDMDDELFKGYQIAETHRYFDGPTGEVTEKRGPVKENMLALYMDIIMYCKENSVPLMFVSTPYRMTAQRSERMNTLADIAGEYGIPFLNCNYYYEEIGIDFTSDMKDRNHVNLLGAKKFTEFFAKYLTEHFDLPDHRGESSSVWNEWNALYEKYDVYLKEKEKILQAVVRSEKQTREAQKRMVLSQDAFEWLMLAKNERYTLVMLANESFEHRPSPKGMAALSAFGYERAYLDESNPVLIVYRDGVRYSSNSETQYDGLLPETQRGCSIVSGEHPQICVGGANYLESYPGGLCIAAVNNLTNDTFDKVSIAVEADGSLTLTHL